MSLVEDRLDALASYTANTLPALDPDFNALALV